MPEIMPKVTFYTHVADTASFACRLATKAAAAGGPVLLWTDDTAEMTRLDRDLWANPPESFLPHEIRLPDTALPQDLPLVLSCGEELPPQSLPVVLNLSQQFWCRAAVAPQRVLEIIGSSPEDLAAARERFKAYRANGFEIEHHNMSGKA